MSDPETRQSSLKQLAHRVGGNRVVRASSAAGTIKGAGLVAAFLLQMLLARVVADPSEYGVYAWGQNLLFLLGSLFALGIPLATSRLVAVHAGRGDRDSLDHVGRSGARWLALASLAGASIAVGVVFLLPEAAFSELPRPVALLSIAASPLVAFTLFHQAMARAQSRLVSAFLPTQVLRPVFAGGLSVAWFLWVDSNPSGIEVLFAVALSLLLVLIVQWFIARRRRLAPSNDGSGDGSATDRQNYGSDRIIPTALPMFATRLSDIFIQYGNVLVLGIIGGPLAAAGFFVADRLSHLASVPRSVISSVVQPWLASAHAEHDEQRLQQVVRHAGHTTLWPTLAIAATVAIAGHFLLGLFGMEYRSAFPILVVLLSSHVLGAALGPAQQLLMMTGHQKSVMHVMALASLCHLLLLLVMIPWLGAVGAAFATLVSTLVARIGCLRLVRSRLKIEPSIQFATTTSNSAGASIDDDE
ncbi:MAG: lipopolysaccharide biosynthesis protein [Xanthomonadales bacterium]|nr:lipopolysaccharide biosynthesis protein [Xanthomonadales bacterium]